MKNVLTQTVVMVKSINLLKPMNYTLKMGEFYTLYANKVFFKRHIFTKVTEENKVGKARTS